VAEHLSFRAAAERLELTAPAVSHSMRQLEARLGVRLNRTTRSVSLTHAGIRLLNRLRPAFNQIRKGGGTVPPLRPIDSRIGELVDGGARSLSILSWTTPGSDRAASVHRYGPRPEIDLRQTFTQEHF
jgi:DNA-binding transcriptional LysR family regulator